MNRLLQCEELKACKITNEFLASIDEKAFHNFLKTSAERIVKPVDARECGSLSGKHVLTTEPSSFIFCKKFDSYITSTETA